MFRLAYIFLKIGALNEMAYRANFWIQLFESVLGMATAIGTVMIIFSQTTSVGGWEQAEMISLLGIYFMILGAINFVIAPSLNKFMADIVEGKLDFTLTKPKDSQLLVSVQEFQIWKVLDIVFGFAILVTGLSMQTDTVGLMDAVLFGVALLCAGAIIYSFWMILATLAFWFIRIENITQIFWAMYIAGRWPVTIYPSWLRWMLTVMVPIAFAVTVPAQAINGKLEPNSLMTAVLLALALLFVSRKFWRYGLRFYSGASA